MAGDLLMDGVVSAHRRNPEKMAGGTTVLPEWEPYAKSTDSVK
jgi:hypothetical protein